MALLVAALLHTSFSFLDHAFSQFKKLDAPWNLEQSRSSSSKSMPCHCMSSSQVHPVSPSISEGGKLHYGTNSTSISQKWKESLPSIAKSYFL